MSAGVEDEDEGEQKKVMDNKEHIICFLRQIFLYKYVRVILRAVDY